MDPGPRRASRLNRGGARRARDGVAVAGIRRASCLSVVIAAEQVDTTFLPVNHAAGVHVPPSGDLPRNEAAVLTTISSPSTSPWISRHRPTGCASVEELCSTDEDAVAGLRRPVRLEARATTKVPIENGGQSVIHTTSGTLSSVAPCRGADIGRLVSAFAPRSTWQTPRTVNAIPAADAGRDAFEPARDPDGRVVLVAVGCRCCS